MLCGRHYELFRNLEMMLHASSEMRNVITQKTCPLGGHLDLKKIEVTENGRSSMFGKCEKNKKTPSHVKRGDSALYAAYLLDITFTDWPSQVSERLTLCRTSGNEFTYGYIKVKQALVPSPLCQALSETLVGWRNLSLTRWRRTCFMYNTSKSSAGTSTFLKAEGFIISKYQLIVTALSHAVANEWN